MQPGVRKPSTASGRLIYWFLHVIYIYAHYFVDSSIHFIEQSFYHGLCRIYFSLFSKVSSTLKSDIRRHMILSIKKGIVIFFWLPTGMGKKFKVIIFGFNQRDSMCFLCTLIYADN